MNQPNGAFVAIACAALLAVNVALANGLRIALVHPVNTRPDVIGAFDPHLPVVSQAAYSPPPFEQFGQTLARPVFSRSRRPFVPPPPPALPVISVPVLPAAPPAPAPVVRQAEEGIVLLGVMINGATKRALLRQRNAPKGRWLEEGEEIGGWRLTLIAHDHAMLQSPNQKLKLPLYRDLN
jgi:hypothetical protein